MSMCKFYVVCKVYYFVSINQPFVSWFIRMSCVHLVREIYMLNRVWRNYSRISRSTNATLNLILNESHNKHYVTLWIFHSTLRCRKNQWEILKVNRHGGGGDSCGKDRCYLLLRRRQDNCQSQTADRHKKGLSNKKVSKWKACGQTNTECWNKVVRLNRDIFAKPKSNKTTKHAAQPEMFHENGANQEKREGVMLLRTKCTFHVLFIQRQLL
jgi:hypothetical protein